mgnify:CR=1 FL=1|tara:strand:- start:1051 stop:1323 length:273 start_codon:yes stop_codon:yes gene_type:complete
MIKYKKNYITFFDYDIYDVILCEMCESVAVDIHHIIPRGIGGSKCEAINEVDNLIALCRECHIKAENNKLFNKKCKIIHLKNIIKKLENE